MEGHRGREEEEVKASQWVACLEPFIWTPEQLVWLIWADEKNAILTRNHPTETAWKSVLFQISCIMKKIYYIQNAPEMASHHVQWFISVPLSDKTPQNKIMASPQPQCLHQVEPKLCPPYERIVCPCSFCLQALVCFVLVSVNNNANFTMVQTKENALQGWESFSTSEAWWSQSALRREIEDRK